MKVIKALISLWLLGSGSLANAQTIELTFPKFAGKTFEFILFQGDQTIKVMESMIPTDGKVELVIPPNYAPYTGMSRWLITNTAEGGGLDMAIPGHGFKVSCDSDKPNNSNIRYEGYDPVNELNRLNAEQQQILDRFETMSQATRLYDPQHPLYASLQQEKVTQQRVYEQFQQNLNKNPNYNARMLPIFNLVRGIPPQLTDKDDEKAQLLNRYITQELNYDDLYTSGHWTTIIQSWVQLHAQALNNKANFIADFNIISQRIKEPKHYTEWVGKVKYYLNQYGKADYLPDLAAIVVQSDRSAALLESKPVPIIETLPKQTPTPVPEGRAHSHQTVMD